jgi:hypothetical protein
MKSMLLMPLICLVSLTACGGGGNGGGGAGSSGTSIQTISEYYDVGRTQLKAVGPAIVAADGSYAKQGVWTEYFSTGGVQYIRFYTANIWDTTQHWTEFNPDGSWRMDSDDP